MLMDEQQGSDMVKRAKEALEKIGFNYSFVCALHVTPDNKISFPYAYNFELDLFAECMYSFLMKEENKELLEKLVNKIKGIDNDDEEDVIPFDSELVRYVKL
jgi:hypothetical protein